MKTFNSGIELIKAALVSWRLNSEPEMNSRTGELKNDCCWSELMSGKEAMKEELDKWMNQLNA